jgi:hypothetical protein
LTEREEQLEKKKLLLEKKINDEVRGVLRFCCALMCAQRAQGSGRGTLTHITH